MFDFDIAHLKSFIKQINEKWSETKSNKYFSEKQNKI